MKKLSGTPLCPGGARGIIHIFRREEEKAPEPAPTGVGEPERLERGRQKALKLAEEQYRMALEKLGREAADIFRLHAMMLEDPDLVEAARSAVRAGSRAEEGVRGAKETFAAAFRCLEDPYLRQRADDVEEAAQLWLKGLSGQGDGAARLTGPVILAARELTPGDLIALEGEKVRGFVVERMAPDSHAAILIRAMGVPALTGPVPREDWEGTLAALDGERGELWLNPDRKTLDRVEEMERRREGELEDLAALGDRPACTRDGRRVSVCANIGSDRQAAQARQAGAEGVGLFRTEFLCLDRAQCPGEEEQFMCYRRALEAMEGRRVVIRTLDIGGDKCPPWLEQGRGENPALGLRGIRLSLKRPELFQVQLRAVLRAAVYGKAALMFPLVTSVQEVRRAREILEQCRGELAEEGIPTGEVEVGVMIETPAAALTAEELAEEADFFSIGTNDLTQYTLAMDRQDPDLEGCFDAGHPAVLELIRRAVEGGHRHGRRVSLCGQLGADRSMTGTLLRLGVDELSVPVGEVLALKNHINGLDLSTEKT